ncbi:MAG TPA: helix-turn-helix domain-containing protein [Bryobacteraceae bacterium]|jgi:HTH-type transcriptional regulator, sugar sensing transcriptional regulator|nr:helix-turn-helix domain-containing protein [Bryobacteraceae bacterium]
MRELSEVDFRRFWQSLQAMGLNAYEARSYLVLVGHARFKALELAARAHVPRQKIYEVLDSLVEKGFAQMIQEKTKLFSAVPPDQAIPSYLARRAQTLQQELADQSRAAGGLVDDLMAAYAEGQGGRGTLDYLRIVNDPGQVALQFRRMLAAAQREYLEFSRPPYAVDPLEAELVIEACRRGVKCRVLVERGTLDLAHETFLAAYRAAGVEVRQIERVPMKMALLDEREGLLALLDPVITKPAWTSVVFEHEGMAEAMRALFEEYWRRAEKESEVRSQRSEAADHSGPESV